MLCVHRLLSLSLYGRKEMLIQIIAVVWMECKKVMKEYLCKKKHNQRSMQFTLATNDFIEPARTLGYSLCEVRTKVDRVAMGYQHFCSLITPAGWTILHVQPIYAAVPPVFDRWKDMFTKLLMWNYKVWQDCISGRWYLSFEELWRGIWFISRLLSAVGDFDMESGKFLPTFNAGFFVLSPNRGSFNIMMKGILRCMRYQI